MKFTLYAIKTGIMIAKHFIAFINAVFKRGAWFVGFLGNYYYYLGKINICIDLILCKIFTRKLNGIFGTLYSLKPHFVSKTKSNKTNAVLITSLLFSLILIGFHEAKAQEQYIRLAWSPNTEAQFSHYNLYRDMRSGTMIFLAAIDKSDTLYTDRDIVEGDTYYYKLTAADYQGFESAPSNEVMVVIKSVGDNKDGNANVLGKFELEQNYPNPFNPSTTIEFQVAKYTKVSIVIYNVLGKEVKNLVNEYKSPGRYQVEWDGRDDKYQQVASGMYFYQMTTINFQSIKKLLFEK